MTREESGLVAESIDRARRETRREVIQTLQEEAERHQRLQSLGSEYHRVRAEVYAEIVMLLRQRYPN